MCGIFGVYRNTSFDAISRSSSISFLKKLGLRSMSRGQDSSGVLVWHDQTIDIVKEACRAELLLNDPAVDKLFAQQEPKYLFAFGHSRMETNGTFLRPENNQPIVKQGILAIHNGIIVNDGDIWAKNPSLNREFEVDTEVICALMRQTGKPLWQAFPLIKDQLEGSYSLAIVAADEDGLLLTTNKGSLYICRFKEAGFFAFASEEVFLNETLAEMFPSFTGDATIEQIVPGTQLWLDFATGSIQIATSDQLASTTVVSTKVAPRNIVPHKLEQKFKPLRLSNNNLSRRKEIESVVREGYQIARAAADRLRRCTRCILPETMPYISFDADGVCSYCKRYQPRPLLGTESLNSVVDAYKKSSGSKLKGRANCIISFSGGRDSSYALHYIVRELGLNPIAFSYDWGMLTDLGRRNQARMCGKLGVEHALVSADIQAKRSYIKMNVEAWTKRPHLGSVPLFMAGDKQYFYHLNRLRQSTGIELVIYADNALEKTDFKYGFANINIGAGVSKAYKIGWQNSLKLLGFYAKEYALNPGYWNASLADTFGAYLSSYYVPKEYLYLFKHILWEEKQVEETLTNEYNWELAPDTRSSWRIGDGTQAFYNYIYFIGAALTEHDTFRSNQIRENAIDRPSAIQLANIGNEPRIDSLIWYFDTIGMDAIPVLKAVNAMQKRYK